MTAYEAPLGETRSRELQGIMVLVVDDDELARYLLRAALEFAGAVVTATSATDAHRAALIADVIVCDLGTAELACERFIRVLRPLHRRRGIPVPAIALVMSAEKAMHAQAMGFERYLMKPVHGNTLRAMVKELARE